MSTMMRLAVSVSLLLLVAGSQAENNKLIIAFGGDPGSPVPHSYDYGPPKDGEPYYRLRIPVINPEIKTVFYDTELIVAADKTVQSISAFHAYRALTHCTDAHGIIDKKLADALPREYTGTDGWQYQSVDGKVVGSVACEQERFEPTPVLALRIQIAP